MPLISVIVPIYNVEKYLHRCVDSILAQTFADFELILVDDGSTDSCPAMCDAYAEKDGRIQVIHKANGGVSAARNTALDVAQGNYVAFCDGDDYWDTNLLDVAYGAIMSAEADWVSFNVRTVDDNKTIREFTKPAMQCCFNGIEENVKFLLEQFLQGRTGWLVCARLFRRELINRYRIRFCETCGNFAEDMAFCAKFLLCAKRIVSVEECLYNYYQRESSMMARSVDVIKLNEINEVSFDVGFFAKKILPNDLYECSIGFIHYYIMKNQYIKFAEDVDNSSFRREFQRIQRKDWFWQNTKKTIKGVDALGKVIGKNPARLIAVFSWCTLINNWYPYILLCRFSRWKHRRR